MDNWDASVVYQVVVTGHQERVARGEAAQRLATLLGQQPLRTRLAATLVALAARLDPALARAWQEGAPLAPALSA